MAVVMEELL